MRNLKRALSLLLSSTMVLGMLVMGSSAQTFSDAEDISNEKAVTIVDGLSIMNGYPDGSFKPEGIVTRAEMAVIISKMLYGPDFNPANFEGAKVFTDTPDWAEGYINLCANLGIISGRGNGIFDPDATVTTSEAATMFLHALGYLQTQEEFGTDWQLAVTSKATNLGMYGDMQLPINAGLSRENVAEMAFNTLFAQRVAYDDYRGLYVKANDRNVVVTNGTEDESNTLAQNTFGLYITEGVVVGNGQTDENLSKSLKSAAQTEIMFTEATDLNKDGKAEYAEGDTYDFEVDTGLDMIGHAASVYYKMENKAPVVYAIVDDATLVSYVDYDDNTTVLSQAANDAGFKKNTILDVKIGDYIVNYDFDSRAKDDTGLDTAGELDGKKLVVISNSANYNVDYVIVLDQYLDQIKSIDDDKDVADYTLKVANATKLDVALSNVAEDDYVIVTDIGNQGDVLAFQAANVFSANISKISGISDASATVKTVVADGTSYTGSAVDPKTGILDLVTAFASINTIGKATLIVDQFGDLIGLSGEKTLPNYAYISEFGVRHSTGTLNTVNELTAKVYFADGTSGVYGVDSFKGEGGNNATAVVPNPTNLTSSDAATYKTNLNLAYGQSATTGAKGIWNVVVDEDDKTIDISAAVTTEETTNGTAGAAANGVRLVKGHSTFVDGTGAAVNGQNASGCNGQVLYQNNDTVYFYLYDGEVTPIIGVKNVVAFTNGSGNGIKQVFATKGATASDRCTVGAVLVTGIEIATSNIYYYNEGNYHIEENGEDVTLTYDLFTLAGEPTSVSYDYSSASAAKAAAQSNPDGYYYAKSKDIEAVVASDGITTLASGTYVKGDKGSTTYVVNDQANYDEYVDNLYTGNDAVGTIADDVKIVDACGSGIDTRSELVNAIKKTGDVKIAFTYSDDDYVADVIFVSEYDPDPTDAPGGNMNATYYMSTGVGAGTDSTKTQAIFNLYDQATDTKVTGAVTVKYDYTVEILNGGNWVKSLAGADSVTFDGSNFAFDIPVNGADNTTDLRITITVTDKTYGTVEGVLLINAK